MSRCKKCAQVDCVCKKCESMYFNIDFCLCNIYPFSERICNISKCIDFKEDWVRVLKMGGKKNDDRL